MSYSEICVFSFLKKTEFLPIAQLEDTAASKTETETEVLKPPRLFNGYCLYLPIFDRILADWRLASHWRRRFFLR